MATPTVGSVVLVRFPFSDLSDSKLRVQGKKAHDFSRGSMSSPAFVLADVGRGDYLLCQITSREYSNDAAIELSDDHFEQGGLRRRSFIRPDKLFTANLTLIEREVGEVTTSKWRSVVNAIESILRRAVPNE